MLYTSPIRGAIAHRPATSLQFARGGIHYGEAIAVFTSSSPGTLTSAPLPVASRGCALSSSPSSRTAAPSFISHSLLPFSSSKCSSFKEFVPSFFPIGAFRLRVRRVFLRCTTRSRSDRLRLPLSIVSPSSFCSRFSGFRFSQVSLHGCAAAAVSSSSSLFLLLSVAPSSFKGSHGSLSSSCRHLSMSSSSSSGDNDGHDGDDNNPFGFSRERTPSSSPTSASKGGASYPQSTNSTPNDGTSSSTSRTATPTYFDAQDIDTTRLTHYFWDPEKDPLRAPTGNTGDTPYASSTSPLRSSSKRKEEEKGDERKPGSTCFGKHVSASDGFTAAPSAALKNGEEHNKPLLGTEDFSEELNPALLEEFISPGEFMGLESLLFITQADREFLQQEFV